MKTPETIHATEIISTSELYNTVEIPIEIEVQDENDFKVEAVLKFEHVKLLNRYAWIAYPLWETIKRKFWRQVVLGCMVGTIYTPPPNWLMGSGLKRKVLFNFD